MATGTRWAAIFNVLGHVPEVGETVDSNGVQLRVERMEGQRITSVSVDRADPRQDRERDLGAAMISVPASSPLWGAARQVDPAEQDPGRRSRSSATTPTTAHKSEAC